MSLALRRWAGHYWREIGSQPLENIGKPLAHGFGNSFGVSSARWFCHGIGVEPKGRALVGAREPEVNTERRFPRGFMVEFFTLSNDST